MNGKIKNIIAALISITFGLLLLLGYMLYINQLQSEMIQSQEKLLKKSSNDDKRYLEAAKKISDSIKTIASEINYEINGKSYSSDEFINRYLQISHEKDKFQTMFEMAKKEYGFDISPIVKKNSTTYKWGKFSRADSAKLTFNIFKNRIRKTSKGEWVYDGTSKKDIEEINNKLKDVMPLAREILKEGNDTSKKFN